MNTFNKNKSSWLVLEVGLPNQSESSPPTILNDQPTIGRGMCSFFMGKNSYNS